MDYTKIKEAAQAYLPAMTKFLRDLIAIPSESWAKRGSSAGRSRKWKSSASTKPGSIRKATPWA